MIFDSKTTRAAAACALLLATAACGGSHSGGAGADGTLAANGSDLRHQAAVLAPLLDDDGQPAASDPRAFPVDHGARTRGGRYATPEQAAALERALAGRMLRVDVACCGVEAADEAVAIAHGMQAAGNLPDSAPMLVAGQDQRLAAAVANRLADAGHSHVWLVTQ